MKTANEKAKEAARRFIVRTGVLAEDDYYFNDLVQSFEQALREQDRDTRHACAEAVIKAEDAHAACMNVTAV